MKLYLGTRRLVVLITFLAVFAMAARISLDSDTWWHLRAGQWIVETRAVPRVDPFSYTRLGESWQYPGWLVQLPLFLIYDLFGPGGLNVWTAAMVTLTFGLIWQTLSGGVFLRAFVTILAVTASGVYWAARPYMVTFLLSAAYLLILENWRTGAHSHCDYRDIAKRLWLLPVLMIIWANSHGGFAVGFILWGVYFAGELFNFAMKKWFPDGEQNSVTKAGRRALALGGVGLFLCVAVCINPHGPVMLLYPFKTVGIEALQSLIVEWQSPDFHQRNVQPFLWLLLLTFGAFGLSRKRNTLVELLLISGFAYLSFKAGRNIALFALVAPMVFTRHLSAFLQEAGQRLGIGAAGQTSASTSPGQSRLNWILLGVLIIAVGFKLTLVIPREVNQEHFNETLPVEAVKIMRAAQPEGQIFNSYNWGAYLMWVLPEYLVFVDGRTDLFGDEIIGQWVQVVQAEEGWQQILDEWEVGAILLEPERPVVSQLETSDWRLLYQDELSVVYGR